MKQKEAMLDVLKNMDISLQHVEASFIIIESWKGTHYCDDARELMAGLSEWVCNETENLTVKEKFMNKAKQLLAECRKK